MLGFARRWEARGNELLHEYAMGGVVAVRRMACADAQGWGTVVGLCWAGKWGWEKWVALRVRSRVVGAAGYDEAHLVSRGRH